MLSWNPGATPLWGGTLCLGAPFTRGPLQFTDGAGTASFPVVILPGDVGNTRNFQWWFRDLGDPFGVGLSDGLSVIFCN